jgi:hypothetical protein
VIYAKAYAARDGDGVLNFEVLIHFCRLLGLDREETADVLEKAVLVEPIIRQRQMELAERQAKRKPGTSSPPPQ